MWICVFCAACRCHKSSCFFFPFTSCFLFFPSLSARSVCVSLLLLLLLHCHSSLSHPRIWSPRTAIHLLSELSPARSWMSTLCNLAARAPPAWAFVHSPACFPVRPPISSGFFLGVGWWRWGEAPQSSTVRSPATHGETVQGRHALHPRAPHSSPVLSLTIKLHFIYQFHLNWTDMTACGVCFTQFVPFASFTKNCVDVMILFMCNHSTYFSAIFQWTVSACSLCSHWQLSYCFVVQDLLWCVISRWLENSYLIISASVLTYKYLKNYRRYRLRYFSVFHRMFTAAERGENTKGDHNLFKFYYIKNHQHPQKKVK